MFRLKTPTHVDYSDVLSPSVVEVAQVLQDNIGLTLIQPPSSQLNKMQVSKSRDILPTTRHVSDVQKPDSTSESKFHSKDSIFNFNKESSINDVTQFWIIFDTPFPHRHAF